MAETHATTPLPGIAGSELILGEQTMGPQVRTFVDRLGQVNQADAAACSRVTLMVAGLPLRVKDQA